MLLIKRLLKFSIPESVDRTVPTARLTRNDPGKPRVKTGGVIIRPRKPVPPT
jgi:hypothetical protein